MRKFLALFLACSLLAVSSVPAVAMATECAPAMHEQMHEQTHELHDMDAHADHGVAHEPVMHEHDQALAGDWQHDRIECGCGCHRSIDSLPHLLAPHALTLSSDTIEIASAPSAPQPVAGLIAVTVRVPVPPPQLG